MKSKYYLLSFMTLILVLVSPVTASAATITYWLNYLSGLDQYRMDYTYPTGSTSYQLHFTNQTTLDEFNLDFSNVPTGILYLTCNGVYDVYFYDSSGVKIGSFDQIVTTQLQHPTCSSYAEATGVNQLNLTQTKNSDGTNTLDWDPPPAGGSSEVYKDGTPVQAGSDSTYTGPDGIYTVINKDANGDVVGRTDTRAPANFSPSGGTAGNGSSDPTGGGGDPATDCGTQVCECIQQLKTVMQEVNDKIGQQLTKLDDLVDAVNAVKSSVDSVKDSVDQVKDSVDQVKAELHPDQAYSPKTGFDYPSPALEDNKPIENPAGKFTDDTTYFTDQGDAEEPPVFPVAPDPATQWEDNDGSVITKDPLSARDPVLQKDQVKTRDPVLNRDPVRTRDPETHYDLRWESSQYP